MDSKFVGPYVLAVKADDYLPKPFDPRELVARINTIVKRKLPTQQVKAQLHFDGLTIDTEQREVYVDNKKIVLTTMEYQLLLMMAESPGKDFSRDDILNQLKGTETELFSRSVDILISRLRSKLKPTKPMLANDQASHSIETLVDRQTTGCLPRYQRTAIDYLNRISCARFHQPMALQCSSAS